MPGARQTHSIRSRAEHRFARLRRQAQESTGPHDLDASVPAEWCISAIARLVHNDESLVPSIQHIQAGLANVGDLYLYPEESLHVSLLGCTQREPVRQDVRSARMTAVVQALGRATRRTAPVRVTLGGLNLVGNQFFIEVLPEDSAWASLRERLAAEVIQIDEKPITYADIEPMHLNIARIIDLKNPAEPRRLLAAERPAVNAALQLATLEVVITDFLVTPATLTVVHTQRLMP